MPNYTLHYFNGRGRAEILRMMMAMAGVKYMDKRYEFSDWDRCRNGKELVLSLLIFSYSTAILFFTLFTNGEEFCFFHKCQINFCW